MSEVEPTTPRGPTVVYVDDERTNCIVFEHSFPDFTIRTFTDASEALTYVAAHEAEVAVFVTDMRMPKISGEQLLRIVKEKYPRIVRIVLTAYSDTEPMLRAMNEGLVARYTVKPWVAEEMNQVLRWGVEAFNFGKDAVELQRRLLETERLATIGRFAQMFVHDLRSPMTSAFLNMELISADVMPALRSAIEDAQFDPHGLARAMTQLDELARTKAEVDSALTMLRNFITAMHEFGKPTKLGTEFDTDPLSIVRHTLTVCSAEAIKNKARVDYRGPATLPHVRMAPTELTQVLINLVSNATQAVAAAGILNGLVAIEAVPRGDEIELTVRDQGVGMPPDVLKRVGTPFFTTRKEGTGLGIASCQRLVGGAGGRLQITSEPGVGTTVTIILPTIA